MINSHYDHRDDADDIESIQNSSGWYGTKSCVPVCVFGFFVLCVCVCDSFHPELGQQDSKGAKLKLSSHSDSNVDKQGHTSTSWG